MAFTINKYNRNGGNKFSVDLKGLPYHSLKEMYEGDLNVFDTSRGDFEPGNTVYIFGAAYINSKSKYGDTPNLAIMEPDTNGEIIPAYIASLPTHLAGTVKDMLNDDEAVEAIKNLKVGFKIRQYHNKKFNVDAYTVDWCDVE